nr:ribonuclease H-like domain-containing protein [Tanacetum cinerariifolium]
ALVELRKKFKKAEKERDELKLTLEKFQTSSKNINENVPTSLVHDRYQSGEGYHAVPHDVPTASETVPNVLNVEPSATKPNKDLSQSNRSSAPIIEDWVFDSEDESKDGSKPVWNHAMRVNHHNSTRMTHPHSKKHVVPTTVLTRSRLVPLNAARPVTTVSNPQQALKDKGVINSGCSRHMTGNISYLSEFEEINGGYVAFGGNPKGGKITGKGKIRTGKLDFDDVYFVKELKFNLFSVSQMCDKKNNVLFTDTECVVLSSDFKLPNDNHVLFRVPRENNV